jgi:ABC-type transport system involved in cytochrome c biogenesis ATPase subunit
LAEVRSNASVKLPSGKAVVVLGKLSFIDIVIIMISELIAAADFAGDNESGKTTLVAKLQGIEDPKKGCGLEYAHIEIRDEYRDGNNNHSSHK